MTAEQFHDRFEPLLARHDYVGDHQIELGRLHRRECLEPVGRGDNRVARILQQLPLHGQKFHLVIN